MNGSRVCPTQAFSRHLCRPNLPASRCTHYCRRFTSTRASIPYAQRRRQHFVRAVAIVAVASSLTTFYTWYTIRDAHAEVPLLRPSKATPEPELEVPDPTVGKPLKVEPTFQEAKKISTDASKDETRDQISSQHLQVKKSWENPGVWAWGANDGKVAAPGQKEALVKNPRWLPFFDGMILRDLKLTREFGAAITESGDLLQWGSAFSGEDRAPTEPTLTLKGKDLISLAVSRDRVLALSSSGAVYSLDVSQEELQIGPKPLEHSSWLPFWSTRSSISYRNITPSSSILGWTEKVTSISSGLEHALLLTSSGRVFSAASGNTEFPSRGQLGVPGLTWFNRPKGPYDQPHEILGLHGFRIKQVATGDYHSVALDEKGRVFAWGENEKGQLGVGDTSKAGSWFDAPTVLPINKLYAGTAQKPHVRFISAGGNTTFLAVDAQRVAVPSDAEGSENLNPNSAEAAQRRLGIGLITSDVWAAGHGIWGQLGTGRWTHVQAMPTRIASLSGLFEYDESARRAVPIRMRDISIGSNYCAATMDNVTYTAADASSSEHDTNWGADVLFFGNNEFFQLGTGKRNNLANPTYIQPMDREAEVKEGLRPKSEGHRFHVTPWSTVFVKARKDAVEEKKGRWVAFEQRVVCGRGVTAVYSGC